MQGHAALAIKSINHFLASEAVPDLRRDAIAFRGHIYEDQGDPDSARTDLLSALKIAEEHGLERYSIEISLAALCVRRGNPTEAERWALSALQTAAADPKTSGAGALQKLITIRGAEAFSKDERRLGRVNTNFRLSSRIAAWRSHLLSTNGLPIASPSIAATSSCPTSRS